MKPFLYQVASLFYSEYGAEVSRLAFVFPNRRTGLFFQKYLSEVSEKPLFSPTILTINDLFVQLSGKQAADRISMLFKLYDIYLRHSGSSETFDEFLYWGEMLLNDFDDIDKYMADARMLFTNVTDLREIENDFSFLSPEQIAAIRTFWSSFYPKGDTPNQEQFLAVWQILYALYTDLREALATEGKGYEGMIFREVVEQMEKDECCDLPYTKVVFVGLNALSVAEERFLSGLQKRGIADFYWDYASPKVTDPDNKASYFVERNLRQFPSQLIENGQLTIDNEDDDKKKIEVIGIPSGIGQAKQVCSILNELCKEDEMSAEEALRTAVILPDEHLLIPVLNAIPEQIKRINVTMGYPLAGTPVASLMEYILALQKNIRYVDRRPVFYFRDVLPILNHRYISTTSPEMVSNLVKDISENNKIYISYDDLNKTPLLSILFTPVTAVETFSDYLINVLQELNKAVEGGKLKVESVNSDTEPLSTFNSQLSTGSPDFYAENVRIGGGEIFFDFVGPDVRIPDIQLGVPVKVNIENGVAAIALAWLNGVTPEEIKHGMATFAGPRRRFDFHLKKENIVLIDDYAHHPAELKASILSVKELYAGRKVTGIFQPHLYTRTRDFAADFAASLSLLDELILLDIYPAREEPIPGVTSQIIFDAVTIADKRLIRKEELLDVVAAEAGNLEVVLMVGAGNIELLVDPVKQILDKKE